MYSKEIICLFPAVAAAVAAYRAGRPVLLLDDESRENEADLVAAAENLTVVTMVRMIRDGSGIVCLCLDNQRADQLALAPMVADNQSRNRTAFTVTIEARDGVSTGVSAQDRVTTIEAALSSNGQDGKIVSPGHVFPLRADAAGVLGRRGHTEGSVDIARLAGLQPAAALCELMNPDGTMARGEQVTTYARQHDIPLLMMEELAQCMRMFRAAAGKVVVTKTRAHVA